MPRNWPQVAERLAGENLMTLGVAARHCPTGRGRRKYASAQALFRWIMDGKKGIYLDAVKMGAGWCTSREALARFAAQVGALEVPPERVAV